MRCYFIEFLSVRAWLVLWPRLAARRAAGARSTVYIIDGGRVAWSLARATARVIGVPLRRLEFQLAQLRDAGGLLLRLRVAYQDLADVQADALREPSTRRVMAQAAAVGRLRLYLQKQMAIVGFSNRGTLWRTLITVHACAWQRHAEGAGCEAELVLQRQPWIGAIVRYAARYGVTVTSAPAPGMLARLPRQAMPRGAFLWARYLRAAVAIRRAGQPRVSRSSAPVRAPMVTVEHSGYFNLDDPAYYSDLFFWQESRWPAGRVLLTFNTGRDPLDTGKLQALRQRGIEAVALDSSAARAGMPVFVTPPRRLPGGLPRISGWTPEDRWLRREVAGYAELRAGWRALFERFNAKVHVTWYRYSGAHCAIADAMQDVGGVTTMYQRAYDSHPSAETTVAADVAFGFSDFSAQLERRGGSCIRYHIVTGYLGDHRASRLRERAQRVRLALEAAGARRILAYADENSGEDARWHTGHDFMRDNYRFLLQKLLEEPDLGLVLKPKVPASLRRRLGPVAELLARAEATGRCVMYRDGVLHGIAPPVAGALAADMLVHGHLCAGTAAVETALAGVPTLLLDREGWSVSPLYQLGVGRVVFTDWPSLWEACCARWRHPSQERGIGDWSPLLEELDPFRDGRATERMTAYLSWLLDGFAAGLSRETVLADAAQRYADQWGADKVSNINVPSRLPAGVTTPAMSAEPA
jgi:hypothetical protein